MIPHFQPKLVELPNNMVSEVIPSTSPATIVMNTNLNHEQRGGSGVLTSFFLEPNTIVPNLTLFSHLQLEPQRK